MIEFADRLASIARELRTECGKGTNEEQARRAFRQPGNRLEIALAITQRTVIGQAQGILMERFDLNHELARSVLQRISSQTNRDVFDIAKELVRSRNTPCA